MRESTGSMTEVGIREHPLTELRLTAHCHKLELLSHVTAMQVGVSGDQGSSQTDWVWGGESCPENVPLPLLQSHPMQQERAVEDSPRYLWPLHH